MPATLSPKAARPELVCVLDVQAAALTERGLDQLAPPAAAEQYRRVTLRRDAALEVATARWRSGGTSSLHGHGGAQAAYRVLAGVIEEERYLPDGDGYRYERVRLRAGDTTLLPPGAFHRVHALEDAVTVHAYSPAPESCTEVVPPQTQCLLDRAREKAGQVAYRACTPSLLETAAALVEGWAEREKQANDDGSLSMPASTLAELRSSGLLAAPMPVEFGGWDVSLAETAEAVRRVARRAPSTALALVMPLGNAATTRIPAVTVPPCRRSVLVEGQRWIAAQVLRGKILAVANSEPGAGGDLSNTKTIARRGDDGVYRLTGRKSFATFGRDADYYLCAARRLDGQMTTGPVDGFFVARSASGLTVDDRWNPVGMRPTASVGLALAEAEAEAILGYPGCLEGVSARHWSTVLFAAVFLGLAEGALREGVAAAPAESIWARAALAEAALNLDAAEAFVEAVAREDRYPMPGDLRERANRAKTFVARQAVEIATKAAMVAGGRCYRPDHPVFRFLCDALAGPLLRPPLTRAMDAIALKLFPPPATERVAA